MKVKFKFSGVDIEIEGESKECEEFLLDLIPAGGFIITYEGPTPPQIIRPESAVETIVRNMKPKKVCDPFARHVGNCGSEDCPIIDKAPNGPRWWE